MNEKLNDMKEIELPGLEHALQDGCTLRGFRSGGGLRVISIENNNVLKGYGEHPSAMTALKYAEEDYLLGGQEYSSVYGKTKDHYLTGSSTAEDTFDFWLLGGKTIDAHVLSNKVFVELKTIKLTTTPEHIYDKVFKTGESIEWHHRNYTYVTCLDYKGACITSVQSSRHNGGSYSPWSYNIKKIGTDVNFIKALNKALAAEEIILEDE